MNDDIKMLKSEKLNMFDLLGFLPEELEDFKVYINRAKALLEEDGVEEFLRTVGRCSEGKGSWDREDFALGIYLGPRIVSMLAEKDAEPGEGAPQ